MLGQVGAVIDHDVPRALLLQLEEVVVVALVRLDELRVRVRVRVRGGTSVHNTSRQYISHTW